MHRFVFNNETINKYNYYEKLKKDNKNYIKTIDSYERYLKLENVINKNYKNFDINNFNDYLLNKDFISINTLLKNLNIYDEI
jgi:5'-deoxynucleotidase YfbR-like HD superfamily hydrolase